MKRLRELRKAANMSQTDLGKKLNLCQQQISSIECGVVKATEDIIINTAEFFNVSTDYLLGMKTALVNAIDLKENSLYTTQTMEEQVIAYMKSVSHKEKRLILELARTIYDQSL